ncbi:ABC transporter substrate-binding protein [Pseudomonadota bacterium]
MLGNGRTMWVVLAGGVLLAVLLVFVFQGNRSDETLSPSVFQHVESVRLGVPLQPTSALALIALEQGLFKRHGLDPVISYYPSGKRALLDGFYQDKVDIAIATEVPVTFGVLNQKPFKIVASLFSADNVNRIVARVDSGINTPKDLRGKRIGTQHSSAVHYFLHLFLLEHGLLENEIEFKYMKAEQLVDSLNKGEIDAFSMREPYVSQATELLADNAIVFDAPGLYQQFDLMVATPGLVANKPYILERLLAALLDAEQLATNQPDRAIDIVSKALGVSREDIDDIWPTLNVSVSLGQAHLIVFESESRWAIQNGLTDADSVPDFLMYIHPDSLLKVRPGTVTMIH